MRNRSSDKATNRAIVQAFLQAAGVPIQESAIHDADEPLPDILCIFADGTRAAFELTETVVQQVARNVSVSATSMAQMRGHYQKLPLVDQTRLQEILGNAHISVQAQDGTTDRKFEQVLPGVFDLLLGCSRDTEGNIEKRALPTGVEEIRITRGRWSTGPFWGRGGLALWVADPTVERIRAKFSKRYECDCPIELLVHSETCPLAPDDLWKNDVHDFITRHIAGSPFCRVSIFDRTDLAIRYAYPER